MEKKYYILIIALLVVLNIFSWRIWWQAPSSAAVINSELFEKQRTSRDFGRKIGFFEQKLNLTPEQKQEYAKLQDFYFVEVQVLKDSVNTLRKQLVNSIGSEMSDKESNLLFEDVASYKLRIEQLTMEHFNSMRNLCIGEQKQVFDTLMVRMLEYSPMFNEGQRPRDGRGGGNGRRRR